MKESKTYAGMNRVAKALDIPVEILDWNFKRWEKSDGLKKDVDYILQDGDVFFTLSGLLWAVCRCGGSWRGAVALAEKLSTDEETKNLLSRYSDLQKKLPEVKEALLLAVETIDSANAASVDVEKAPEKTVKKYCRNSSNLPDLTKEQEKWIKEATVLLDVKARQFNKMGVHIQKRIYTIMNHRYGVVWDQEKIDTCRRFGLEPSETKMTTLRCIAYNDKLRSIYHSLLADYGTKQALFAG